MDDRAALGSSILKMRRQESIYFHLIFAVTFTLFFVVAAVARLSAWKWSPWPPGPNGYSTVVNEAKSAANTFAPFAFME
jgi:light-harvesting complex 1 beta chain